MPVVEIEINGYRKKCDVEGVVMKRTVVLLFKTLVTQPDEPTAIDEALNKFRTLERTTPLDELLQKGVSFPTFPSIVKKYPVEYQKIAEIARDIDAALNALGFGLRAEYFHGDRNSLELWYDGDDLMRIYVTIEREVD